jgi:hypothetical protein
MPPYALDEDVAHDVAGLLRSMGYDADSAKELGRLGLSDVQVLVRAVEDGRTVVTANSKDFKALHEAWVTWRARWEAEVARDWGVAVTLSRHFGILIVPHLTVRELGTILIEFADSAGTVDDRLFAWTVAQGWHEPRF